MVRDEMSRGRNRKRGEWWGIKRVGMEMVKDGNSLG